MRGAGDLYQAAAEGDEQFVELVVGSGGLTPNVGDCHGRTALHLAASNAHLAIVQFLVAQPVWATGRAGRPCQSMRKCFPETALHVKLFHTFALAKRAFREATEDSTVIVLIRQPDCLSQLAGRLRYMVGVHAT